jgi:hypothetical protein
MLNQAVNSTKQQSRPATKPAGAVAPTPPQTTPPPPPPSAKAKGGHQPSNATVGTTSPPPPPLTGPTTRRSSVKTQTSAAAAATAEAKQKDDREKAGASNKKAGQDPAKTKVGPAQAKLAKAGKKLKEDREEAARKKAELAKPGKTKAAGKEEEVEAALRSVAEEHDAVHSGWNQGQSVPSGSGGERKTAESGGEENGSQAGGRGQSSTNNELTGNNSTIEKPASNESSINKSNGRKTTSRKSTGRKSTGRKRKPTGRGSDDESSSDDETSDEESSNEKPKNKGSSGEDSSGEDSDDDKSGQKQRDRQLNSEDVSKKGASRESTGRKAPPPSTNKPTQTPKPSTSKQATTEEKKPGGADASKSAKKPTNPAANPSKEPSTPATGAASDMPPPPRPQPSTPSNGSSGSQAKNRAVSETPAKTPSNPPQGRSKSELPTPLRKSARTPAPRKSDSSEAAKIRAASLGPSVTTPASAAAQPGVERKPWLDGKGRPVPRCERHEGDLKDLNVFETNPQDILKEGNRRKRELRDAAKRDASTAGIDSPSDQSAAKRAKHRDPADDSQVDSTVQSDGEQPSPLSSIAEDSEGSGTDEEGDAHENDQPADPEEDLYRFENDRIGKDIVRYMRRLDDGESTTYEAMLVKFTDANNVNGKSGISVVEGHFLSAIQRLVRDGRVREKAVGEDWILWIPEGTTPTDYWTSGDDDFEDDDQHGNGGGGGDGDGHISDPEEEFDILDNEFTAADERTADVRTADVRTADEARSLMQTFITHVLPARQGVRVTSRELMNELVTEKYLDGIDHEDFRLAVDVLLAESVVLWSGEGAEQELWIDRVPKAAGGTAATGEGGDQGDEEEEEEEEGEEDEDEEDEEYEDVTPDNDKSSSSDDDDDDDDDASDNDPQSNDPSGNDPGGKDPNGNDPGDDDNPPDESDHSVWTPKRTESHRKDQLKVLIVNALKCCYGKHTKSVDVMLSLRNLLCERLDLDKGRGAEVVQATEFEWAVDKLVEEEQVKSEGRRKSRRNLFLYDEGDEEPEPWEGLDGWRPRDFLPPDDDDSAGDGNNSDAHEVSQSHDLGEAVLRYLRSRRGVDTKYADLWVAMKRAHERVRSITAEEFRRVIQRMVRDDLVQESGAGPTRIIRVPAGTTPTGGSALGDEAEEDENQDGDVAKKSGGKSSSEDGLEAKSPGQAHKFRQPSRVEKSGNSRQPNRMTVDRSQEPETSWVDPVGGDKEAALESGYAGGSEVQDDAEVEEQPPVKESGRKGRQNTGVQRNDVQDQRSETPTHKPGRKRKAEAKADDPGLAEEGTYFLPDLSEAEDANLESDDEEPPQKRVKNQTPRATKSKR